MRVSIDMRLLPNAGAQKATSYIKFILSFMEFDMLNAQLTPATSNRFVRSLALRTQAAGNDDFIGASAQIDNGDEALYADK